MKKVILLLTFVTIAISSSAQKKAVTESGDEVLLFDDGTWKPANDTTDDNKEISINPKSFTKSSNATFLLKSSKLNIGVWMDSKKWIPKKATNNQEAEYELQLKGKDLYGMMICEKIEVPLKTLKALALSNARNAAPDIKIIKEEYRTVNGNKVMMMQMNGTTQGIKFSYYGYYFSNSKGTLQFITYTAQNLLSTYINDIEELLNGLVTTD
jgi:hypothetical protein